ncbi:hypothetical protein BP6252_11313 [Coleophoma cylindrospora]|uniref:Heterokaryon incompatibility domain-containing protein n=1 Tax=Coleophoma cylindrospora TaxID=1849047 RepID=A0A3D8QQ12_9HELO|nr:hypothetical protein BP6252_11313 [Coleophoma cylindrospora]
MTTCHFPSQEILPKLAPQPQFLTAIVILFLGSLTLLVVFLHIFPIMPPAPKYQYTTLDERSSSIRLLTLEPALHEDDEIRCSLKQVEIASAGPYEALSYVWGDARVSTRKFIVLEGCSFSVTVNLWHALRNLRPKANRTAETTSVKARTLWVDAICINQDLIPERNSQVQMMRTIYHHAARVVIFLSGVEAGLNVSEGHALIRKIHAFLIDRSPTLALKKRPYSLRTQVRRANLLLSELPSLHSPAWDQLALLFSQNWFNRVWVIQEVSEASEAILVYSGLSIDWFIVEIVAQWVLLGEVPELQRKFTTRGITNAIFMGEKEFKLMPGDNVLELFHRVRDFQATDPRDKVFAMLTHPVERVLSIAHVVKSRWAVCAFLAWVSVIVPLMAVSGRYPGMKTVYTTISAFLISIYFWPNAQSAALTFTGWVSAIIVLTAISSDIPPNTSLVYSTFKISVFSIAFWPGILCILLAVFGVVMEHVFSSMVSISTFRRETVGQLLGIQVDYALSIEELYDSLNKSAMAHYHDLQSLSYVVHGPDLLDSDERTSWTPQQPYKTNANAPHSLKSIEHVGKFLALQGLQIDTITSPISELLTPIDFITSQRGTSATLNKIMDSPEQDLDVQQYRPTGEPLCSALLRTLTADRDINSNRTSRDTFKSPFLLRGMQSTDLWPPLYNRAAVNACVNRKFFRTGGGYMGLGPQAMRAGDIVVVFFGAGVPFVLRRVAELKLDDGKRMDGSSWRLVGQVYIHGLMDGEGVAMWKAGGLSETKFVLR